MAQHPLMASAPQLVTMTAEEEVVVVVVVAAVHSIRIRVRAWALAWLAPMPTKPAAELRQLRWPARIWPARYRPSAEDRRNDLASAHRAGRLNCSLIRA